MFCVVLCHLVYHVFREGFDMEHGMTEGVHNQNKSGYSNNTPEETEDIQDEKL